MQELINKANVLMEALPYIQRFAGKTFVIKIDGSIMDGPFFPLLLRDLVLLHRQGIRVVLVPASGQEVTVRVAASGGTAKEGVGRTYAGVDGYCPLAAYLGSHGFCLELALRPGVQHSAAAEDVSMK